MTESYQLDKKDGMIEGVFRLFRIGNIKRRRKTVLYVGLDVHKEFCQASVLDENGEEISNERVITSVEELDRFLDRFQEARFVLESTGVWEFVYGIVEARGFDIMLAHPLKVKAISSAKIKTDKVDARTLARLLYLDMVPSSHVPSRDVRDLRELLRHRKALVEKSTAFKNRVHAELLRRGIKRPEALKSAFSSDAIAWMRSLDIRTVSWNLDMVEALQTQIKDVNRVLLRRFEEMEDAQLVATVPGIGYYGAMLIAAEIDDVRRFETPAQLCSYAGLVPSVHQSSSSCYYGHISKQGSRHLRWMMVEAVHVHLWCCPESKLSTFYRKLARKKGKQVARIATARKMLHMIYWMLLNKEEFKVTG